MPSFLTRWFGSPETVPAHLVEPLAELDKLGQKRTSLQGSCQVMKSILVELFAESLVHEPLALPPEQARAKLAEGVPLLRDVFLSLDDAAFRRRTVALCAVLQEKKAEHLSDELCKKRADPLALLHEVIAGRPEAVAAQADALGLDSAQLATVLRLTALPALMPFADALAPFRHGIPWEQGYCPTCGSWPLLGESRGLDQLRYLRCGWCASAWEGGRLRCVFCGNQDHHSLGYFHAEGEEDRLRAATCDECRGYVKVISTLSTLSPPQLLVADLASLHLDLVAADRGFHA